MIRSSSLLGAAALLLLLSPYLASGAGLLGDGECTWGPSHWCSGLQQSALCWSTRRCIVNVWSSNPYPADDDDVCKICKEMVKEARDQLESNETQLEIKEVFEGSCKLIPIEIITKECIKLSDEFIVELMDMLASEMDPDTVCTVSGLCNSGRIDRLIEDHRRQNGVRNFCDVCHDETQRMSLKVRLMSKNDVVDKGLELCARAPSYSYSYDCSVLLLDNFETVYESLTHLDFVCESSGVCSDSFKGVAATTTTGGDDLECEFCEKVIQHWIDEWKSNSSMEEFKQVMEALCNKLGQPDRIDRCLRIVDDYYIPVFEYVLNVLKPKEACAAVGLCGAGGFMEVDSSVPISVVFDASSGWKELPVSEDSAGTRLVGGYFAPQTVAMRTQDCSICESILNFVGTRVAREWLQDEQRTQDEIEEGLTRLCSLVRTSQGDQCDYFVWTYGPAMIKLIAEGADPAQVCTQLRLCKSWPLPHDASSGQKELPVSEDSAGTRLAPQTVAANMMPERSICEFIFNHLGTRVAWAVFRRDPGMIKVGLYHLCSIVPTSKGDQCHNFVGTYGQSLVRVIAKGADRAQVCTQLQLYKSEPLPHDASSGQQELLVSEDSAGTRLVGGYFAPQTVVGMTTPGCSICEFVLYRLKEWLNDERTQDEIERELNAICSVMPTSLGDQCDNFVGTYGPAVIKMIVEGVDPAQVCTVLQLCKSEPPPLLSAAAGGSSDNPVTQMRKDNDNCATCQYVLAVIEGAMKNKDDQDEIRNVLSSVCNLMPSSIADRCESFINTYAEEIMQMVADNMTPEQICEGLGMCERRKPVKDGKCVICEYVINTLDSLIVDKTNEETIKKALEDVCGYLPKTVTKECVSFVDTYTEEIINLLAHGTSPEEVCTTIGLCNDGDGPSSEEDDSSSEEDSSEEVGGDTPYCMLCEYAIGELDNLIEDKQNEEQVKEALDTICYQLSKPISKECVLMVNKYTDEIVEMFVNDYSPERVCVALRLCEKKHSRPGQQISNVIEQDFVAPEGGELQAEGGRFCGICEFGISVVENRILNSQNLDVVERAILMMCSHLPQSVADKCEDLVQQYGDEIIHLIVDTELSPREVCSEMRLCPEETLWDATSVGGRKCEWGPALWCKSTFHASACGTTEYCVRSGRSDF